MQAANGTLDQTGLNTIAAEIEQLVEAARAVDERRPIAGRYMFSGTATLTPPFPAPALTYAGDDRHDAARHRPGRSRSI